MRRKRSRTIHEVIADTEKSLTLKPGTYKTGADMKLIKKVERMLQQVYDMIPGERLIIHDRDFFLFWEYQYNPDKGETARGEFKRWAEALYHDKKISVSYQTGWDIDERIEFKNDLETQLDDFIFKLQKFEQAYGFAAKPFAYLAHPKDGFALFMQMHEKIPLKINKDEPFEINGIPVIESHNVKEGEALFVRK